MVVDLHAAATSEAISRSYVRRAPDHGVLHRVVREHLQTFLWELDRRDEQRGAPLFVKREFQRFVRCGVLAHGFARFRCTGCGTDRLVAFSCKGRGFCPSCGGRRMTERAAHLIDHVLPFAPVRQWVLSLPFELRYRLAWDHALCRAVLAVYTRALLGFYRKRAKASGQRDGRTGTVTVIQRFGGALNLNVHFHTLAVDGVFVREPDGSLSFAAAKAPTDEEVEALLDVIRARILRLLVRRGLLSDEAGDGVNEPETPPLHALYAASVRQRVAHGTPRRGNRPSPRRCGRRSRRRRRSVVDKRGLAASTFMPTPPSVPRTAGSSSGSAGICCGRRLPKTVCPLGPMETCSCGSRRRGATGRAISPFSRWSCSKSSPR